MGEVKNKPMVSVFMPAYNQEHLIAESIESVLAQDFDDWELVIGDDCSTDNTYGVADSYRQKYPDKIQIIRNPVNLGITGNCNSLLKNCNGKYIAFTAGDDLFLPKKLSLQVALMEENQDCVLSYHDIEVFGNSIRESSRYFYKDGVRVPFVGDSKCFAKRVVESGCWIFTGQTVMIINSLASTLRYEHRIPIASDFLFWVDYLMINSGSVLFIDEVLAKYRSHSSSVTGKGNFYGGDPYITLGLIEYKYQTLVPYVRKCRAKYFMSAANTRIDKGDRKSFKDGRILLLEAIRLDLGNLQYVERWLISWRLELGKWLRKKGFI